MKPYTPPTNSGRIKAEHEIHHETSDGGLSNRKHVAKSQRKAARQYGKKMIDNEV